MTNSFAKSYPSALYSQMISNKFRLEIPLSCMSSLFRGVCRYLSLITSKFENYQYSMQGHFLAYSCWKGVEPINTFPKDNMPGYLKNVKFLHLISQSLARLISCWRQPGVNTNIIESTMRRGILSGYWHFLVLWWISTQIERWLSQYNLIWRYCI